MELVQRYCSQERGLNYGNGDSQPMRLILWEVYRAFSLCLQDLRPVPGVPYGVEGCKCVKSALGSSKKQPSPASTNDSLTCLISVAFAQLR